MCPYVDDHNLVWVKSIFFFQSYSESCPVPKRNTLTRLILRKFLTNVVVMERAISLKLWRFTCISFLICDKETCSKKVLSVGISSTTKLNQNCYHEFQRTPHETNQCRIFGLDRTCIQGRAFGNRGGHCGSSYVFEI